MPIFRLDATQALSTDLATAWEFFSDPHNLAVITPPEMRFRVTGDPPSTIHPGLIITYRLTPLPAIPLNVSWATEITHVNAPYHFADEQLAGPYALWHHEHHFQETDDGVHATDRVHWSLPLDPISAPLANFVVIPQLRHIFDYRARKLEELFSSAVAHDAQLKIQPL